MMAPTAHGCRDPTNGGMMTDWAQITSAVTTTMGGDAEGGRVALTRCWEATGPDDHAARCVLAHYLADLEPDLADEVAWDELALVEFASIGRSDLCGGRHSGHPAARPEPAPQPR